jgi:hypothetical protein
LSGHHFPRVRGDLSRWPSHGIRCGSRLLAKQYGSRNQ